MEQEHRRAGMKRLMSKTVDNFPDIFKGSRNGDIKKCTRWWENKHNLRQHTNKTRKSFSRVTISKRGNGGLSWNYKKALPGRGRKRARWNVELGDAVLCEFDRLRKAGLRFNTNILQTIARQLIAEAPADSGFHRTVKSDGEYITKRITPRWAQHFMENHNIVVKRVGGKLRPSDDKLARIEKEVAFHLGQMKRGFESRLYDEDCIENADETHFVCNMHNGKTLGFKGEDVVSYADVVSGGQSMTMMVRLSGGKNALIMPPMLVFQNADSVRSIRNVPDTVPGVFYRTSPKGWIDRDVWKEWLQHEKSISSRFDGKTTHLFVDNCSSHIEDEDAIKHLQTKNTNSHRTQRILCNLLILLLSRNSKMRGEGVGMDIY